jgi:hypothetical protein
MEKTESLKEIERRAYRSTFADGIYDMFFGVVFLILAWIPVLESIGIPSLYGYLFGLIPLLMAWLGKRYVTVPRLGAVEFGAKRRSRRLLFLLVCAALFFLTMPLLLMTSAAGFGGSLADNVGLPMGVGLVVAPLILVAAYFLDYPRMYIYAVIIFFSIPHSGFLYDYVSIPFNSLISFGIPGLAILVYGISLLVRFMKRYPKPTQEVAHVSR